MTSTARYANAFHNPHRPEYGPEVFETSARPAEYRGFLIYRRLPNCWDVVSEGVCVGMRAGPDGARRCVDARLA